MSRNQSLAGRGLLCAGFVASAAAMGYAGPSLVIGGPGASSDNIVDTLSVPYLATQLGANLTGDFGTQAGNGPCDCFWENGDADNVNAVVSETNVTVPDSQAADDFFLPEGKVFRLDTFCGCMVTNDLEQQNGNTLDKPDAILYFYDDCNGKPGEIIETFTNPTYTILGNAPFGSPGQYKYVRFCFQGMNLYVNGQGAEKRFWASLVGVGDNQPGERYFWATSKTAPTTDIQGVQAQLRSSWIQGFSDWRDVQDTNGGCHDLCFEICGDLCEVICENGPYALDCGLKMLNTTFFGTKAADNFQLLPCTNVDLCLVEAYIATNCEPSRSKLEIYRNVCDTPANGAIGIYSNPDVITVLNNNGTPRTFNSPVSGLPLTIYCLRWKFEDGIVNLVGGQNYWIAVYLEGTGVITEEAYFLCKQESICHIKITQARYISAPFTVNTWEEVGTILNGPRDMAFRILGRVNRDLTGSMVNAPTTGFGGAGENPVRLIGDIDADGKVDLNDLVQVLNGLGSL